MVDLISVAILVAVAGLAGLAGYLTRIVQKLEDKRDKTYLTELPGIYSNLRAFNNALKLYESGDTIIQLLDRLKKINERLHAQIFSANVLVFKRELYLDLYNFSEGSQNLQAVFECIQGISDGKKSTEEQKLRSAFTNNTQYAIGVNLHTKPKDLSKQADDLIVKIDNEFKKYHSYSWKLMIIIFALGAFGAIIEILKELFKA